MVLAQAVVQLAHSFVFVLYLVRAEKVQDVAAAVRKRDVLKEELGHGVDLGQLVEGDRGVPVRGVHKLNAVRIRTVSSRIEAAAERGKIASALCLRRHKRHIARPCTAKPRPLVGREIKQLAFDDGSANTAPKLVALEHVFLNGG